MCGASWNTPLRQWPFGTAVFKSRNYVQSRSCRPAACLSTNMSRESRNDQTIQLSESLSIHSIPSCQFTSDHVAHLSRSTVCCTALPCLCTSQHCTQQRSCQDFKMQTMKSYVTFCDTLRHFLAPKASCLCAATSTTKILTTDRTYQKASPFPLLHSLPT